MALRRVEKTDQEWKEQLTGEEYAVCRQAGTEPAFTGVYNDCKEDGLYRCRCCDLELFHSNTKYESGSGWPSFWEPVDEANVVTVTDSSLGMIRTEVLCAGCDAHLGHVFPDGPEPTGQRFCLNSVSLRHEKD